MQTTVEAPRPTSKSSDRQPLLDGNAVPSPVWFRQALAKEPERSFVLVNDCAIEALTWGDRGKPGILFLHGNGAHADWWSFIAPFFADDHRVVALSWSGMGNSQWRDDYPIDVHVREAVTVAENQGLFESEVDPLIVAHSFGGFVAIALATEALRDRLGKLVIIDPPIFAPETVSARAERRWTAHDKHLVYPAIEDAIRRFRFAPAHPCENLFIADFIARSSLKFISTADDQGWTWRFDRRHFQHKDLQYIASYAPAIRCPVEVVLGQDSSLHRQADLKHLRGLYPENARELTIPAAGHHVMVDQPIALITAVRNFLI